MTSVSCTLPAFSIKRIVDLATLDQHCTDESASALLGLEYIILIAICKLVFKWSCDCMYQLMKLTLSICWVQFLRDVEDEKMWINERLARAKSPNYGNSLLSVQMLLGKNRTLRNEIDSHEPTVIGVVDLGLSMIEEGHPQSDEFQQQINELNTLWADLQNAVDQQKSRIEQSEVAQQVCCRARQ